MRKIIEEAVAEVKRKTACGDVETLTREQAAEILTPPTQEAAQEAKAEIAEAAKDLAEYLAKFKVA